MNIVYFTHSLLSCWNHGNAHFLRGVLRELHAAGHAVRVYEPRDSWSLQNLLNDYGRLGLEPFHRAYPELTSCEFSTPCEIEAAIADADLVVVHEWNEPWVVSTIGILHRSNPRFRLFFHDTHHRAVSNPDAIDAFDLENYDGVLAFGNTLAAIYRQRGWGDRVFVWHEAADTRHFHPPLDEQPRAGLVWIGNWGDGERAAELARFLLRPAAAAGLPLDIYGVRYPAEALALLARHGAVYRGWLANALAPEIFARHLATVHVPRRYYTCLLPGIPTIRVFEALACGIPLVSAPWDDSEHLFTPGTDYLVAHTQAEMTRHLAALHGDADLRTALTEAGRRAILARHTCGHRAQELLRIAASLTRSPVETAA